MGKMSMTLSDFKKQLQERHGYDDEFAETLSIMAESLSDYYGEEYSSLVYSTVLSTIYEKASLKDGSIVYETGYDVLKRKGLVNSKDAKKELDEEFRRDGAISTFKPSVALDGSSQEITGSTNVTVLPYYFNSENPSSLGILARETMRQLGSSLNASEIEGNTLRIHKGLCTEEYTISKVGDQTEWVKTSSFGRGLEEGRIRYDELCFMRENYDENYEPTGPSTTRIIAGYLSDNLNLRSIMRESAITKDKTGLQSAIDENISIGYEDFIRQIDELDRLEKEALKSVVDSNALKKAAAQRDNYFADIVAPNVRALEASIKRDEVMTNGYTKS